MKRLLLAILILLGMASGVWADSIPTVVGPTTEVPQQTVTVFNDAGTTLESGDIVAWDNDDTEYDRSGFRYVTTTTSADFIWTAGVVAEGQTCADQTLCEIVTEGWTGVKVSTVLTEDTVVSTSTTAGFMGDATAGNNVCYLGRLVEYRSITHNDVCTTGVVCLAPVEVRIVCVP